MSGCSVVGVGLAAYCSFLLGNPLGWVALHALCGWFYLMYLCMGCGGGLPSDAWTTPAKDLAAESSPKR